MLQVLSGTAVSVGGVGKSEPDVCGASLSYGAAVIQAWHVLRLWYRQGMVILAPLAHNKCVKQLSTRAHVEEHRRCVQHSAALTVPQGGSSTLCDDSIESERHELGRLSLLPAPGTENKHKLRHTYQEHYLA